MAPLTSSSSARRVLTRACLATFVCVASGCLTTLDLSEEFGDPSDVSLADMPDAQDDLRVPPPDMSTSDDMTPERDLPLDMPVAEDVPTDLKPDMPDMTVLLRPGEGLIISELTEGESNDKAVEVYNDSDFPVSLDDVYMVLLGGSMSVLSTGKEVALNSEGALTLNPGEVLVLCHKMISDPTPCDILDSSVVNFNGDDRLGLFYDSDKSGQRFPEERAITSTDRIIDTFGHMKDRAPEEGTWAEATFQRCNRTPYLSDMVFEVSMYYLRGMPSLGDLGSAPAASSCML